MSRFLTPLAAAVLLTSVIHAQTPPVPVQPPPGIAPGQVPARPSRDNQQPKAGGSDSRTRIRPIPPLQHGDTRSRQRRLHGESKQVRTPIEHIAGGERPHSQRRYRERANHHDVRGQAHINDRQLWRQKPVWQA